MKGDHQWSDPAGEAGAVPENPVSDTIVIRAWHEPGHPQGFRARITYGEPPGSGPSTIVTADPAEVLRVVKNWLGSQPGVDGRNQGYLSHG